MTWNQPKIGWSKSSSNEELRDFENLGVLLYNDAVINFEEEFFMTYKIVFGTDGWRGVIAEDYTFDNLRRAAQGFATYLLEQGKQGQWVVVGHDKRFQSE